MGIWITDSGARGLDQGLLDAIGGRRPEVALLRGGAEFAPVRRRLIAKALDEFGKPSAREKMRADIEWVGEQIPKGHFMVIAWDSRTLAWQSSGSPDGAPRPVESVLFGAVKHVTRETARRS
jgi:hypothetical protein